MKTSVIDVALGQHSYPVYIGQHLLAERDVFLRHIAGKQVFIVTQKNIAAHYLSILQNTLQDFHVEIYFLPEGEQHKNLETWQALLEALMIKYQERSTTLIALGGGMVGDVTGFAAACYLRGVRYLQIPTTLMAQVDSALGGKTAVNHALGKNLIGAFYQPHCVVSDLLVLMSLPPREYIAGFAEVIKYALIWDAEFFGWLQDNYQALLDRDLDALLHVVSRSTAIKAQIVSQDERDQGLRQILNFGHTFGHALETFVGYQTILHGEAVAVGMVFAAELSVLYAGLSSEVVLAIKKLLQVFGLPVTWDLLPSRGELISLFARDKKVVEQGVNFILLVEMGSAKSFKLNDISKNHDD